MIAIKPSHFDVFDISLLADPRAINAISTINEERISFFLSYFGNVWWQYSRAIRAIRKKSDHFDKEERFATSKQFTSQFFR